MNVTLTSEGFTLDGKWRLVPVELEDGYTRDLFGDFYTDRIKAAPNPPQSLSPWQPIATAPKDGTHVLLSYPGRITYGYWLVLEVGKLVGDCGGACRCPEYDEAPDPFWYSEDGGFTEEYPPTHWMPLPEPAP